MNHDASTEKLFNRWAEIAGHYTRDPVLPKNLFIEIETAYNSSGRYYHTLSHVANLLDLSHQYAEFLQDKEIVDFAIFYHDIIYDVLRSDNEERSASIAKDRARQLEVPLEKRFDIVRYIIASRNHQLARAHLQTDIAWFLDFDMSILGSDWDTYRQYLEKIRKEYAVYPGKVFATGRREFLLRTISMQFIFSTPQFRMSYEPQARINMQRELGLLQDDV